MSKKRFQNYCIIQKMRILKYEIIDNWKPKI